MLDRNAIIVLCVAVLTVLIGGAVVWRFISLKRLRGELSESSVSSLAALRKDNDRTRELTLKLGASLTEIREGLSDTAARLAEAEKDLQDIADRLNEVESQDPDAKMYSRAVKMAQHGAPLAEIIDECEITAAEAQLIYKMYAPKGRQ